MNCDFTSVAVWLTDVRLFLCYLEDTPCVFVSGFISDMETCCSITVSVRTKLFKQPKSHLDVPLAHKQIPLNALHTCRSLYTNPSSLWERGRFFCMKPLQRIWHHQVLLFQWAVVQISHKSKWEFISLHKNLTFFLTSLSLPLSQGNI